MRFAGYIILGILAVAPVAMLASDIVSVSGEYTFYGESTHSPAECRELALQGAKVNALAKKFGTVMTQTTGQQETLSKGSESTFFDSFSMSETKGEWIADEEEPKFETSLDGRGDYVVHCSVKGKARAISNRAVDFDAKVLRNGTQPQFADTDFRNGDDMFVSFRSPVDGYAAVYLSTPDRRMYRLLPYSDSSDGAARVSRDRQYIFFSTQNVVKELGTPTELTLFTEEDIERNRIYVVFSPNQFTRPLDDFTAEEVPRSLTYETFNNWLLKSRRHDDRMSTKMISVTIRNK